MGVWVEFEKHYAGYIVIPENIRRLVSRKNGIVNHAELRTWVEDRCVELLGEKPLEMYGLPYAASPVLNSEDNKSEAAWTLCYTPLLCRGRGSCPKERACSE